MMKNTLSYDTLKKTDPRYLFGLEDTISRLTALGLSYDDIEDLFISPVHRIYVYKQSARAFVCFELMLCEADSVIICKNGEEDGTVYPEIGSKEWTAIKTNKSITHPVDVYHSIKDIDIMHDILTDINQNPDFTVLWFGESCPRLRSMRKELRIRVKDFCLSNLEHYADSIRQIMGNYCERVSYPNFQPDLLSHYDYFSKGYPVTTSGMVIDKIYWMDKSFVRTRKVLPHLSPF